MIQKAPAFSAIIVTTVAIGIAANTTILSVADALFLRRLPVAHADRIVHVDQRRQGRDGGFSLSLVDYQYYKAHSRSFDVLGAHYPTSPMQLTVNGEPQSINGSVVTASYFEVLSLQPVAGRLFTAEEDAVRDRDRVVVISDALWSRTFGRNPTAIGSTVLINAEPFTVVGVTPPGFAGVLVRNGASDVWIPSAMFKVGYRYCDAFARGCTIVQMLGRLRHGETQSSAQSELEVLAAQLEADFPDTNRGLGVRVIPAMGATYPGEDGRLVRLLLLAVIALLMIACANAAGLLIAHGVSRRKEIAARLALGASGGRIVRQLLVESMLLSLLGGLTGVVLSFWTVDFLQQFYATDYAGRAMVVDIHVSLPVLGAAVALSLLTGVLFGILPALRAGRSDVMSTLREEAVASGARRTGAQRMLVVGQIAVSVVLLVGAALVLRSLLHLYRGDGFDPTQVVVVRLRPSLVDYSFEKGRNYQRQVIQRLESMPGVVSASPSVYLPVVGNGLVIPVWRPEQAPERPSDGTQVLANRVGPRFFHTLDVDMIDGRDFSDAGRGAAEVVISERLGRRLWPESRALGRPLVVEGREHAVVGVVSDAKYAAVSSEAPPSIYLNYWQASADDPFLMDARTHIRVIGSPRAAMTAIRRELAAVDSHVPLSEDYPLSDRIAFNYQPVRVATAMLLTFGAAAMFLSAIGLYGVLAFNVRQRNREIAIRLALGAERATVLGQVLGQGVALAVLGTTLGLLVAFASAQLLASLLYGVSQYDTGAFAAVPIVLIGVAVAASYWPARAAASVDPAGVLRGE